MTEYDIKLDLDTILGADNLAEELTEDELECIGHDVCDGYDVDMESRGEWEDNVDEWTRLALQVAETKTFPWPNAANVKYPLITTAALQFSARAYPALIPGTNVVRGRVVGFDPEGQKLERAVRVGKHMSYQLLEQMDDWEEEMDRLLFALPIVGCMFKKTYYDAIKRTNTSEIVYPKELVVNYWAKTLEEAERVTHVLKLSENDVHERVAGGVFLDQELQKSASLLLH
jgi:chaperonin GroES